MLKEISDVNILLGAFYISNGLWIVGLAYFGVDYIKLKRFYKKNLPYCKARDAMGKAIQKALLEVSVERFTAPPLDFHEDANREPSFVLMGDAPERLQ